VSDLRSGSSRTDCQFRDVLVAEATDGKNPDLVITVLLHDAIEDQEVPHRFRNGGSGVS
jgi:hypothetical protein